MMRCNLDQLTALAWARVCFSIHKALTQPAEKPEKPAEQQPEASTGETK